MDLRRMAEAARFHKFVLGRENEVRGGEAAVFRRQVFWVLFWVLGSGFWGLAFRVLDSRFRVYFNLPGPIFSGSVCKEIIARHPTNGVQLIAAPHIAGAALVSLGMQG